MTIDTATANSLEYIAERAADVYRAFTPGARPDRADVATSEAQSRFTFDSLSVAPPDDAYLVTSDARERTAYTQNGTLQLVNGTLCGSNGRPVLGFTSENGPLSALHVDAVDLALHRASAIRIEADGSVAYDRASIDPRTGARETERVAIGRLALARFPAATKLGLVDADHGVAPLGVVPHVGRPADGNFAPLATMHQEASRVDLERSLERLKDAYVAFDALQAAHKAQGSLGKTVMDLLK